MKSASHSQAWCYGGGPPSGAQLVFSSSLEDPSITPYLRVRGILCKREEVTNGFCVCAKLRVVARIASLAVDEKEKCHLSDDHYS